MTHGGSCRYRAREYWACEYRAREILPDEPEAVAQGFVLASEEESTRRHRDTETIDHVADGTFTASPCLHGNAGLFSRTESASQGFVCASEVKQSPGGHRNCEAFNDLADGTISASPWVRGNACLSSETGDTSGRRTERFRRFILALVLLLVTASSGVAVEPGEQLKNPALEARARAISAGLRCLVCQNETIDESNASLAHDIRVLLRERLTAGDTDERAIQAIVNRYGEFVLLNPPVRPATYVLWFGPAAILLAGVLGGVVWMRRRATPLTAPAPLTPAEQSRLDMIMRDADH